MQKGRERKLKADRKKKAKHKEDYREWLVREREAYEAHVAEPEDEHLLHAWIAVWREEPRHPTREAS